MSPNIPDQSGYSLLNMRYLECEKTTRKEVRGFELCLLFLKIFSKLKTDHREEKKAVEEVKKK